MSDQLKTENRKLLPPSNANRTIWHHQIVLNCASGLADVPLTFSWRLRRQVQRP